MLFGHEKGAFPGAFDRLVGVLQNMDGGTIVFDEVDRLSPELQERLAEALSKRSVRPVGAKHSFKVDLRIIATSNLPLTDLVATGGFRADLLDVLAGTRVILPPLRERASDIPALARHFLGRIGEQPGLRALGITEAALKLLGAFDWPGNVRQLQAVLFRAAVFCDESALTVDDFPQLSELLGELEESSAFTNDGGRSPALHLRRQPAPARRDRGGRDPPRHRPLSRTNDRGRAAARDRAFDPLPQAQRPRHRKRGLNRKHQFSIVTVAWR